MWKRLAAKPSGHESKFLTTNRGFTMTSIRSEPLVTTLWLHAQGGKVVADLRNLDHLHRQHVVDYRKIFHGGLPSLSYAGLVSLQDVNPLLVDVRTDAERLVSIIPGAIPSRQVDKELLRMDAERPLVAVCTVGLRAGLWASNFAEKQECNRQIFVYEGILLHALDGGEVVKQTIRADGQTINTPVEAVHCFARSFEFAPDGWETAVFPPSIALFESLKLLPRMLKALLRSLLLSRASTGS